ncbi:hypothetical protein AAT19DRAFT_11612 [Rhodotorula toruloides]|uniref:Uncharacterized protein n=1 Tax=Rhodotorula toruloides TaxID=5286 RepID=A0A2S9ZW27_RHOTO|nr:hypothetical protein AAT19DRAFT_11612 [Rhodotorula toruloides]
MSSPRLTVPQTLEAWVGAMFAVEVKVYYVYRAVRVTKHRSFQALAILLGLGTICGFLGRAIIAVRIRLDAAIPPRQAVAWTLPVRHFWRSLPLHLTHFIVQSAWAFAADGLLCALILVYELVYKRRAAVVTSSLVQQFTTVAVRSSVALLPLLYSMAVIMTVGFVTQKQVYIQTGLAMSRIFPFVSCCIVFTCLPARTPVPWPASSRNDHIGYSRHTHERREAIGPASLLRATPFPAAVQRRHPLARASGPSRRRRRAGRLGRSRRSAQRGVREEQDAGVAIDGSRSVGASFAGRSRRAQVERRDEG